MFETVYLRTKTLFHRFHLFWSRFYILTVSSLAQWLLKTEVNKCRMWFSDNRHTNISIYFSLTNSAQMANSLWTFSALLAHYCIRVDNFLFFLIRFRCVEFNWIQIILEIWWTRCRSNMSKHWHSEVAQIIIFFVLIIVILSLQVSLCLEPTS